MTTARTLEIMDTHWGALYQAPHGVLSPGISVTRDETDAPDAIARIYIFRRDSAVVVMTPPDFPRARAFDSMEQPVESLEPEPWVAASGCAVERVVGPAWVGVADASDLLRDSAPYSGSARVLTPDDAPALRRMAAATSPEEWEHGALDEEQAIRFGLFAAGSGDLMAAAGYQILGGEIAHICVATHPGYRGRGAGRTVVFAATRHALGSGLVVQYRTLRSNTPSVRLAQSLGFRPYGETLTLRLRCG